MVLRPEKISRSFSLFQLRGEGEWGRGVGDWHVSEGLRTEPDCFVSFTCEINRFIVATGLLKLE